MFNKINAFFKGLVLVSRPHIFLGWLKGIFKFSSNTLSLSMWIAQQDKDTIINDFYTWDREYSRRFSLYQKLVDHFNLANQPFEYLEFGVADAGSFKWWLANCQHAETRFYGFDTFEGLPEDWGVYNKGDMAANIPEVNDSRAVFIKGLFQKSVPGFLSQYELSHERLKVIHLDADLFSSTLYALTTLAPFLKKGDILLFDEFNVPNHEFLAFKMFTDSYYIRTKLLGAVNNYLQVALIVE